MLIAFDVSLLGRFWMPILRTSTTTLELFGLSVVGGTLLGLVLAMMRVSRIWPVKGISWILVWILRGVPALILLFFAFYGLPELGVHLQPIEAGALGLSLSAAAYNAEIIRSGIISVASGQWEAAQALALPSFTTWRRIILPQSIRIALPPYMTNAITLLKSTSLASTITILEMTGEANRLISTSLDPLEILTDVALIYILMAAVLAILQGVLEKAFELKE